MDLDRRELLRAGAVAAGAVALGRLPSTPATAAPSLAAGGLVPELVTVTERGFQCWWVTDAPSDTPSS